MIQRRSAPLAGRWFSGTERVMAATSAAIGMLLMFVITIQVIARYLAIALPGVYELAQLLLVAIVFLGIAFVQSENGHVGTDVAVKWLPPKQRRLVDVFVLFLSLGTLAIMTWRTGVLGYEAFRMADVSLGLVKWPLGPPKILASVGCFVLSIRLFLQLLQLLRAGKRVS